MSNPGAETRKSAEDMGESSNQEPLPFGCGHLATLGPRKRGPSRVFAALLRLLGERLLPQSSYALSRLGFPYKCHFWQRRSERRLGLDLLFIF